MHPDRTDRDLPDKDGTDRDLPDPDRTDRDLPDTGRTHRYFPDTYRTDRDLPDTDRTDRDLPDTDRTHQRAGTCVRTYLVYNMPMPQLTGTWYDVNMCTLEHSQQRSGQAVVTGIYTSLHPYMHAFSLVAHAGLWCYGTSVFRVQYTAFRSWNRAIISRIPNAPRLLILELETRTSKLKTRGKKKSGEITQRT